MGLWEGESQTLIVLVRPRDGAVGAALRCGAWGWARLPGREGVGGCDGRGDGSRDARCVAASSVWCRRTAVMILVCIWGLGVVPSTCVASEHRTRSGARAWSSRNVNSSMAPRGNSGTSTARGGARSGGGGHSVRGGGGSCVGAEESACVRASVLAAMVWWKSGRGR